MAGGYTPSANPNKRLYNGGSEWQDDIDGLADYYSTFFREYDAVIGRFNGVDPESENDISIATYVYSGNNPLNYNDPLGNRKLADFRDAQDLADYIRVMGTNNIDDLDFQNYTQNVIEYLNSDASDDGDTYERLIESEFSFTWGSITENEVRNKIIEGQKQRAKNPGAISEWQEYYHDAVGIIVKAYPTELDAATVIKNTTRGGWEFENGEDFNTAYNDKRSINGSYTVTGIKMGIDAFDKFASGNIYWNFGALVRSIYHEFIHVFNHLGLNGYEKLQGAENNNEREVIAINASIRNRVLPSPSISFIATESHNLIGYFFLNQGPNGKGVQNDRRNKYAMEVASAMYLLYMFKPFLNN